MRIGAFWIMIDKININILIKEHFHTLYIKKYDKINYDYWAIGYLFIIPFIIAVILLLFNIKINENLGNALLTSLSILSPLMFGFFPFIYNLLDNNGISKKGRTLIKEFKSNVLFTMLLSFLSLGLLLIWVILKNNWALSFIIFFVVLVLITHILMIIQRFNFLINEFIKFKNNNE